MGKRHSPDSRFPTALSGGLCFYFAPTAIVSFKEVQLGRNVIADVKGLCFRRLPFYASLRCQFMVQVTYLDRR